jgi:hypothetical protein
LLFVSQQVAAVFFHGALDLAGVVPRHQVHRADGPGFLRGQLGEFAFVAQD